MKQVYTLCVVINKHPVISSPGYEPSFKRIEMNSIHFGVLKHNFKNTVNAKRFLIGTATGFSKRFFSITAISPSLLISLTKMYKPRVQAAVYGILLKEDVKTKKLELSWGLK